MSKVILKLSYKHPNLKRGISTNKVYLNYIATRSGVAKTITEKDLEKELAGAPDIITKEMSESKQYIKYIENRPNSHGLFDAAGVASYSYYLAKMPEDMPVYRMIISLREVDAAALGYDQKETWENLIRKKMPDLVNAFGMKNSNTEWCAAVHLEKGHPHVHVIFWEIKKTLGKYTIPQAKINKARKILTDEIYAQEKEELYLLKNTIRDTIREESQELAEQAALAIKNNSGIELPELSRETEAMLRESIKNIAAALPGHGRAAYKLMPPDVKRLLDAAADNILSCPEMILKVNQYLKSAEDLAGYYTTKEEALKTARDNAYSDLQKRVANSILRAAVTIQRSTKLNNNWDWTIEQAKKEIKEHSSQIDISELDKTNQHIILKSACRVMAYRDPGDPDMTEAEKVINKIRSSLSAEEKEEVINMVKEEIMQNNNEDPIQITKPEWEILKTYIPELERYEWNPEKQVQLSSNYQSNIIASAAWRSIWAAFAQQRDDVRQGLNELRHTKHGKHLTKEGRKEIAKKQSAKSSLDKSEIEDPATIIIT